MILVILVSYMYDTHLILVWSLSHHITHNIPIWCCDNTPDVPILAHVTVLIHTICDATICTHMICAHTSNVPDTMCALHSTLASLQPLSYLCHFIHRWHWGYRGSAGTGQNILLGLTSMLTRQYNLDCLQTDSWCEISIDAILRTEECPTK